MKSQEDAKPPKDLLSPGRYASVNRDMLSREMMAVPIIDNPDSYHEKARDLKSYGMNEVNLQTQYQF